MKRKSAKKHPSLLRKNNHTFTVIRYVSLFIIILVIILGGNLLIRATDKVHVLGTATGPEFTGGQSDANQSDNNNNASIPTQSQDGPTPNPVINNGVPAADNTQVDCVNPNGSHFTTDFHNCQELNQKWGNNTFNFMPLTNPQQHADNPTNQNQIQQAEPTVPANHQIIDTPQGKLEVQTEGSKGEFNLQTAGAHIEMKREDNGSLTITAHKPDGTEVQLQSNALNQINDMLKDKEVTVGTTSAAGFTIKSGDVQAETNFPLSIDPSTKSLAVTTPNGTSDLNVLPNQAVQTLLQQNVLSNVLSSADQTTASAAAANKSLVLTEINNQPAFAVQGVLDKKLLGIFPVAFQKTVYVSAQNGQVLQTQEAIFNQILQAFSF